MTVLEILVTPTFLKAAKKLHAKDKGVVDQAVRNVASNPDIGDEKKGDLAGVFVYKFRLNKQEVLLAYRLQPDKFTPEKVVLLGLGSHENFYTELKRL
ncbi:type II toxin-antitoxin system RelE/ParE family toxin [Rugamonas sp. DEMB1]|nr:type II toxin-antitoxin system RelE/ParE family toxin [Rugamonas sp. DEMB1]